MSKTRVRVMQDPIGNYYWIEAYVWNPVAGSDEWKNVYDLKKVMEYIYLYNFIPVYEHKDRALEQMIIVKRILDSEPIVIKEI